MEQFGLSNKNILITGASSGIGNAIASSVDKAGGSVFITGRSEERLKMTINTLGSPNNSSFVADLTDEKTINQLVDELPILNGIVHSAGITTHMPARFLRKADFEKLYNINFLVPVMLTARILKKKKLASGGSIVFISSLGAKHPYFGGSMYRSSKSAIESYSQTLALELAPGKIRSNCLSPTFVKTPMVEGASQTISEEAMEEFDKNSLLGFGQPDDVANAAIFLLSDAARWISGANIPLGGY
jgi:NAD(P)-dependent dehydrogenase (short-subunit alcohol dehydrogenase family)